MNSAFASTFQYTSLREFEGQVIILGALFEKTLMYRLWKNKVNFEPYERIQSKLRYTKHDNKAKLHFKYFTPGRWSKYGYSQIHGERPIVNHFTDAVRKAFQNLEFLYSINKNSDDPFKDLKGILLPCTPHGMNEYQHVHHVAFIASYNPTPHSFTFYKSNGIDSDEVNEAIMLQAVYQAIMRSSLRDPDCKEEHIIIVPTLAIAESLAELFSNCEVSQLPDVPEILLPKKGRPTSGNAKSGAKRQQLYKRRKMIQQVLELNGF